MGRLGRRPSLAGRRGRAACGRRCSSSCARRLAARPCCWGRRSRRSHAVPWQTAAAFPVPALTADQVLSEVVPAPAGEWVLVHGAGSVTGGLAVQLAVARGATIVATAGPASAARVRGYGAAAVFDYRDPGWPARVRTASPGGRGVGAAVNTARGGAVTALQAVAEQRPPGDHHRRPAATRTRSHGRRRLRPRRRHAACRTGRGTRRRAALTPTSGRHSRSTRRQQHCKPPSPAEPRAQPSSRSPKAPKTPLRRPSRVEGACGPRSSPASAKSQRHRAAEAVRWRGGRPLVG
jgi:hypothetical protein